MDCRYTLAVIRNIIFDWSGTLVDDLPAVWKATNYVLAKAQRAEMTLDQFRAEFCLPFTIFYDRHIPDIPLPQLEEWFHSKFKDAQDSVCELPHAREFLECCRAHRLRTFLLSTVHPKHFAVQAAATDFAKYLDKPYLGVWDKRKRIHEILEENRLNPDETMFVGDMQHDIETARHGGVHSCAVLTGYNTLAQLRAVEPDIIVEHLGELRFLLEQNNFEIVASRGTEAGQAETIQSASGSRKVLQAPAIPPIPLATVGALIFNDAGEVLMIRTHKWSDLWGIPGGKIKWGESSLDALRRELLEETALEIVDTEFVMVQDCIHSKEFYRDAHFVLLNFTSRCAGAPRVKLNEEGREFRWVTIDQALAMPVNEPTRKLLLAVAEDPKGQGGKTVKGIYVENKNC